MDGALFDLDQLGRVIPTMPCGHYIDGGDGPAHELECLAGVCPCCKAEAGAYEVWLHHNPRGYVERDGVDYCAFQRHMFDVVATCLTCRSYTFGAADCLNLACPTNRTPDHMVGGCQVSPDSEIANGSDLV